MINSHHNSQHLDINYLGHMHNLKDILLYLYFKNKSDSNLNLDYTLLKNNFNFIISNELNFSKKVEQISNLVRASALNIELCSRISNENAYINNILEYDNSSLFKYLTELCSYYNFDMDIDLLAIEEITFENISDLLFNNGINIHSKELLAL